MAALRMLRSIIFTFIFHVKLLLLLRMWNNNYAVTVDVPRRLASTRTAVAVELLLLQMLLQCCGEDK